MWLPIESCTWPLSSSSSGKIVVKSKVGWPSLTFLEFYPAQDTHFEGLREAAVKSFKTHFRCVVGIQLLSFSALFTLICQIIAILNARPLCTTTDNLSTVLTPVHLCTGQSTLALPEVPCDVIKGPYWLCGLLLLPIFQQFWCSWSREYLLSLCKALPWVK